MVCQIAFGLSVGLRHHIFDEGVEACTSEELQAGFSLRSPEVTSRVDDAIS
jgi:hypothetical protein